MLRKRSRREIEEYAKLEANLRNYPWLQSRLLDADTVPPEATKEQIIEAVVIMQRLLWLDMYTWGPDEKL